MRTLSPIPAASLLVSRPSVRWNWRLPRPARIVVIGLAALVGLEFLFAARPPGMAIRADLAAGAAALRALPSNASPPRVTAAVRDAIRDRSVQVDPSRFPTAVAVTIQDLDWRSCVAAQDAARRLEGKVVVELQGFASADACRESNAMTWWLMP
jgi:hypothetical protein